MQTQFTPEDVHALTRKLTEFVDTLPEGERAAFDAIERQISMLIPVDDVDVEAEEGDSRNPREALWYRLAT
jgi:hypothetical protein